MGCCASAVDEEAENYRLRRPVVTPTLPKVTWKRDESWTAGIEVLRQKMNENGKAAEARAFFETAATFGRGRAWLMAEYPECAREGTIEGLDHDGSHFATSFGCSKYPALSIITLDSAYTGVVLAATVILARPLEEGQEWHEPGAMMDTPEMEGAKHLVLKILALLVEDAGANVSHAEIQVIVGADMVRCKFNESTSEPTITPLNSKPTEDARKSNANLVKAARQAPERFRGQFLPAGFSRLVASLMQIPGTTIWDEGELPFQVGGAPYPHATRLLVGRDSQKMEMDINSELYRVKMHGIENDDDPIIFRNLSSEKDPGGVVRVVLVVAISDAVVWPETGAYSKTPAMEAASSALLGYIKALNKNGRMQRCTAEVVMGVDKARYSFIGEKFGSASPLNNDAFKRSIGHLDGFSITLEKLEKNDLAESESRYQAFKEHVQQRARDNPERYRMIMPHAAVMAARHVMELNFPGRDISDEEFSESVDGKTIAHSNARLVVVRDLGREKNNVEAAVYVVLSPGGGDFLTTTGTNWLGSREMKAAEEALLGLLKSWHKDGKISDDCMAQVLMGTDASIYKFVDGERFEDYDDERMKQLKWF